ncbi:SDR family oxidoreductase [Salinibacterium sp.]|uniref:SDR family oxidoreductase n=1 Tax=Salinibacterium sp. TaxID=1915057 RepID=UPI00286BA026|nr:SDR family oxidoreductase [Salinibacterium sp.]
MVSVASWGAQVRKAFMSLSDDEWHRLVEDNLTAVFRLYRSLIPALTPHGVLVQLNGMSAENLFPGSGGVALTAAATKSLTRTLAVELEGSGRRNAPRQDSAFLYVGRGGTPFAQANIVFAGDDSDAASPALQPFLGLP